ncbi:cytoskeleton assembly control protein SLA2, partial [Metschnikowia bicuspidata]
VNGACKALVSKVQHYINKNAGAKDSLDLSKLTSYEGKTLEMEQQVQILKLENSLSQARKRLTEIRKYGYKDANSDDEE